MIIQNLDPADVAKTMQDRAVKIQKGSSSPRPAPPVVVTRILATQGPAGAGPASAARFSFNLGLGRPSRRHWLGYLLLAPAVLLDRRHHRLSALLVARSFVPARQDPAARPGAPRAVHPRQLRAPVHLRRFLAAPAASPLKLVVIVTSRAFALGLATALLVDNRFQRPRARAPARRPALGRAGSHRGRDLRLDLQFLLRPDELAADHARLDGQMINWFSEPAAAFAVVCVAMVWKGYPFVSIMMLAGLQSIPEDFYNAARVDGANALQRFVNITIPEPDAGARRHPRPRHAVGLPRLLDHLRADRRRPAARRRRRCRS